MAESAELQQRRNVVTAMKSERAKAKPSAKEMDEWIADHRVSELPQPPEFGGWHFLGSFTGKNKDAAFKKDWGPEKKVDLAKEHDGKKWEPREYGDGKVHTVAIPENSAAYFYRTVTSAKAQEVMVSLGSDDAIKVFLNGKQVFANNASRGPAPDQDKAKLALAEGENHLLLKIVNAGGPAGFYFKLGGSALPENILALLAEDVLSAGHVSMLCDYYEKSQWPLGRELDARMKSAEKAVTDYDKSIVTVMTMGDLAKPRKTYVLSRGHYASPKKDEEISPGIPAVLPSLPEGAPAKRLGLAKWIAVPDLPPLSRPSRLVRRRLPLSFSRAPWHLKHCALRMGRILLSKNSTLAASDNSAAEPPTPKAKQPKAQTVLEANCFKTKVIITSLNERRRSYAHSKKMSCLFWAFFIIKATH